ncbi:cytochrome b561 [Cupriavidus sp. YR651]|uniref:cytochrome b n=1 Tax=Cupriavidus sp. YR651 TaxID=1855315 RepID=UPI00087E8813|nr:cytochrome b [Cupriavidus sp. YR651]SDC51774.1 cytochrome b561 [Cupriavidus sp. YR651]
MRFVPAAGEPDGIRRYAPPLVYLHWAMFVLVGVAYVAINLKGMFPRGSDARSMAMATHEVAGILVLGLAAPRLLWRLVAGAPPPEPGPRWSHVLAHGAHIVLYAFLFAQPVLGWLTVNATGHAVELRSLGIVLPTLVSPDKALGTTLKGVHEWLGTAFYLVIGLHAMAALFHHYMLGDNTLRRMGRGR